MSAASVAGSERGRLIPVVPEIKWEEIRVQGQDPLAVRASRKLKNDGLLVTEFGPTLLRRDLDRIPLWRGDHVIVRQLADDYAQYLYLTRVKDSEVLLDSIRNGLEKVTWRDETFAYAEGWDESKKRYRGLVAGKLGSVTL